ncbi:transcriptional regulator [Candidatus Nitrosotenuis sp. DW1]|uniref:transcriptional regulator n=1 Tax=Candidatus Nitrosotenuis sp. DW1 TaxID=2259672 RepID=UPI0015CDC260|nr:transcriptional regulator [Candidatus Nitrosotenuis sp. DW1]QLH09154.1 transcriptional regulator [Candidatus Nitrosotenuis sp. DW1]
MAGLDRLLSKHLDHIIQENLGDKIIQKVENRLVEKYGITLTESIEQFQKLDSVLREFFGAGADGLEKRFLESICNIKTTRNDSWVSINNSILTKIILEAFGDICKKRILDILSSDVLIISQIIEKCDIAQTSGYRKINSLIDDGLLVPSGYVSTSDGKKVTKYRSVFDNVKIEIVRNDVKVAIRLAKEEFAASSVLTVCTQA